MQCSDLHISVTLNAFKEADSNITLQLFSTMTFLNLNVMAQIVRDT